MDIGRPRSVLTVAALTFVLSACASAGGPSASTPAPASGAEVAEITPQRLNALIADDDYTVVNVHIPFAGDIPGTDLSIPFNEIEANLAQLPDRDANIVLYCRSGPMSVRAAETLQSLGYTHLSLLTGGMNAWEDAGFELEQ